MKPEVKDFVVKQLANISALATVKEEHDILRMAVEASVAIALDRVGTERKRDEDK